MRREKPPRRQKLKAGRRTLAGIIRMPIRQPAGTRRQGRGKSEGNAQRKLMTGRKIVAAEFQHAPGPGVIEYGGVRTLAEKHEFIEYPATGLLRLSPGDDGASGDAAVKDPVIAYMVRLRLLPRQMILLNAHTRDIAPLPVQVNRAGQPIRVPGLAHEIQSDAF